MGRKIVLLGTKITDTTAPVLSNIDPIESKGSVMLLEPGHPLSAVSGAAIGTAFPNLFHANVSKLATAIDTGWEHIIRLGGTMTPGTDGLLERTSKGGLHGIVTQVAANKANGDGWGLSGQAKILAYITSLKAKGDQIYASQWGRTTRAISGPGGPLFSEIGSAANAEQFLTLKQASGWTGPTNVVAQQAPGGSSFLDALAPWRTSARALAANASLVNTTNIYKNLEATWASPTGSYNAAVPNFVNSSISWVFYRWYIENLTVSGRSYEEVDAIDQAMYNKEVLTAGGRYYGDTFTAPSTIA